MNDLPVWARGWEIGLRDAEREVASALVTGEVPRYVRKKAGAAGVFDRMPPAVHCFGHFFESVPWAREPDEEFWTEDLTRDPNFAALLRLIEPTFDHLAWVQRLGELADWFATQARGRGITAGRSNHDSGRNDRNVRVGQLWKEAERGSFGAFVHSAIAAYVLASVYDFCGAWMSGLWGFQPALPERERRWAVYFGLGPRGIWSRWEDPSNEERWPSQELENLNLRCWLNFKMAMRMTKHSTTQRFDPGLFQSVAGRTLGERRALSALFYYFVNMTLQHEAGDRWFLEYKGQKYTDCILSDPDVWVRGHEAVGKRDYTAFVSWYDERRSALSASMFELAIEGRRISVPLV